MSWRDSASQEAQDDLDGLLNHSLGFAMQMLEKHGEFMPFAATVTVEGDNQMVMAPSGIDDDNSLAMIGRLRAGVMASRDELRAAALTSDVRINGSDAIRVEVEHREGQAMTLLLTYSIE